MSKITTAFTLKLQTKRSGRILFWLSALPALAAIVFLAGCKSEFGDTGLGVLPPGDLVGVTFSDTTTIRFSSERIDSVNTRNSPRQLFGNYIDPEFGTISAAAYLELTPGESLTFGPKQNLKLDSVILFLDIDQVYGRPETFQVLVVQEVTESLPDSGAIPSNRLLGFNPQNLANRPAFGNVPAGNGTLLRIKIDNEIGRRILFASDDTLGSTRLFKQLIKGFRISTEPVAFIAREPGAIFRLFARNEATAGGGLSSLTSIRIYYQVKSDTTDFSPRTVTLSFNPGNKYTHIERSRFEAPVLLGSRLAATGNDSIYEFLQAGALVRGTIEFPYLTNLERVGLLRAELFLPVAREFFGSNQRFVPPIEVQLALLDANGQELIGSTGALRLAHDAPIPYSATAGGYVADLTEYVQQIIAGRASNNGLRLYPANRAIGVNRAVLHGVTHPTKPPVLRLTYTSLPR